MNVTGIELGIPQACDRVLTDLDARGKAWVVGQSGSGRTTLAEQLLEVLRDRSRTAAVVNLLEVTEEDAPIGALYLAASTLPDAAARTQCFQDWPQLADGAAQLAGLAPDRHTLIVLVHSSWERTPDGPDDDWSMRSRGRAHDLLRGLARSKRLNIVWITSRNAPPGLFDVDDVRATLLPPPRNARALFKTADWGSYSRHAAVLEAALDESVEPSPLMLRLAVGLVALGVDVARVVGLASSSTSAALGEMAREMSDRLSTAEFAGCRSAVARLLLARRPLAVSRLSELTGVADDHLPLLTQCVGYGAVETKVSSAIRASALGQLASAVDADANHRALADYFASCDGAPHISDTWGGTTQAWLEKQHHLARTTDAEWTEQPCRELYWSRARYLSIVRKDFRSAAAVYDACTRRFADDSYGWHYLAYNLERCGGDRKLVESSYEKAVTLQPSNPWWNSRRVTFLLGQGRPRSAKAAWMEALQNVDPDGERVLTERWLPEQLHNWVARAWLEAGNASEAFSVLRGIPDRAFESLRLRELRQLVLDAVEADAIGESVYPRAYPIEERWKKPSLQLARDGKTLDRWFRGRVVAADAKAVRIVYASRLADGSYEASVTQVEAAAWKMDGFGPAAQARGFVELGVYTDGARKIVPVDDHETEDPGTESLPLAYFDRWRSHP